MKRSLGVCALAVAWASGCGSSDPSQEITGVAVSPIQGGTSDTTHDFAVAVVQFDSQTGAAEICSGALLAPNLVATARHCVSTLASPQIVCGTSPFEGLVPENQIFVSAQAAIATTKPGFVTLAPGGILVPTGAGQADVCGNDIALLILKNNIVIGSSGSMIDLASYVVPAIDPPMTDSVYSNKVTAIGYGIDTPTDDGGVTAGLRRIKENIGLVCIPNDPNVSTLDCFQGPNASVAKQVLSANEFVSGDSSTCEGDSGSNAFDQGFFDKGQWVSFGVLSRGSVSPDGQTCVQPIYTRFDAWSSLLITAAKQAQAAASPTYPLPLWAGGAAIDASLPPPSASSSSGGAATASTGQTCLGTGSAAEGTPCACANDCASNECVTIDGSHYVCANPCNAGSCSSGFSCHGTGANSYCFPGAPPAAAKAGGCSAAPLYPKERPGRQTYPLACLAIWGLLRVRIGRRRGRIQASKA